MKTPEPLKNSQIQVASELDHVTLFWKKPSGGFFRYFIILFVAFWLCGWAMGFVVAVKELLVGKEPPSFLAPWLAMWTLFGIFALALVWLLVRPHKPEAITLEPERFRYDTGLAPLNFLHLHRMLWKKRIPITLAMIYQKRKIYTLNRWECREFILDGIGDDQRLRFDDGADRIEIGESLKEPERECLAQVLNAWRTG